MIETILTNGRVVTRDAVRHATLVLRDGMIAAIDDGGSTAPGTLDLDNDYVLPGLVELHTDNLERHFAPRPGVLWPTLPAMLAHDAEIATAGITTVLDAIAIGDVRQDSHRLSFLERLADAVSLAGRQAMLRANHLLHLRCEVSYPGLVELFDRFAGLDPISLISLMDHTPGQRQFVDIDHYRRYQTAKYGLTEAELDGFIARLTENRDRYGKRNRAAIVARCRAAGIPLASHDDATAVHVTEAIDAGAVLAEFPTTIDAAKHSRAGGMKVLMGGPNLVRGGSHSGNVSARVLAEFGLLDVISSDYIPSSALQGVFMLAATMADRIDLPNAVAMASRHPAEAVGLTDRGEIAPGLRADVIRVRLVDDVPVVRSVWVAGKRVA